MAKKVLSVVLALVIALGVCAVAVSAATTSELNEILASLPDDYNARFYNDKTVDAISAAKTAAAAAIASGSQSDIDSAYALCEAAKTLVEEKGQYYAPDPMIPGEGEWKDYPINRDESKAHAYYQWSTDASKYLKAGDTFTLSIKLKTDFYISSMYLGFAYDATKFEIIDAKSSDAILQSLMSNGFNYKWGRSVTDDSILSEYWPSSWTDAMKEQYNQFCVSYSTNTTDNDIWMPTDFEDAVTVTFKVLDNVTDGTGKIYMSKEFTTPFISDDADYTEPSIRFDRASGSKHADFVLPDECASYDQTIAFPEDINLTIGEAPAAADYTYLDAAIASIADYTESDYTAASWKVFADAVAAGKAVDRNLTADSQSVVDAATKAIVDAREALEFQQAEGCRILSVVPSAPVQLAEKTVLDITVEGNPTKVRFVNKDLNTWTYDRNNAYVIDITDNGNGTETWKLRFNVYAEKSVYSIYAKYAGEGWVEPAYKFALKVNSSSDDKNVYSYEINECYDGVMYNGVHKLTVVTGAGVYKVQLYKGGNTWTYTANNATVDYVDGNKVWTIDMNFAQLGDQSYSIRVRTLQSAFEFSDKTINVEVRYK